MFRILIFNLFFCFPFYFFSQNSDNNEFNQLCHEITNKKALSLYEKGINKKKYKKLERLDFLMKALELEPDFAEVNLAMGLELAARCKLENKPFTQTLPFFFKAIYSCPNIHSEPYYYIGYDYYERMMNDSAIKYLDKFISFKDENDKKYANDFTEELYQAKMMVGSAKKELGLRRNVEFDPKVVKGVSTERDEYLAYISPDDKNCFFIRKLPIKSMNQVFSTDKEREVFIKSQRNKNGVFTEGEAMPSPFNETADNQGGCSISINNKNLYFAMTRMEGGLQPNCDIYISDFIDAEWTEIRKLSANVNDPKYWDSQPSISSDGITLYFASDRPGGYGGIDLYYTRKDLKTGQWSIPKNLGPTINTKGDEKTPFIHSDSETLYFSSTGHFGFGKYDIFYTKKNEKGDWIEPVNIGSPINSESDDVGFFVSADAKTAYFFSFTEGKLEGKGIGRYDLFSFNLYEEARPQVTSFLKGNIKDSTGNNIAGAIVEIKNIQTKKTSYATVDSSSGEYMVAIKKNNDILITVKKDDIAFNVKKINVNDFIKSSDNNDPKDINIQVRDSKVGHSFVIENIYYSTTSSDLKKESIIILESFADYLKDNQNLKIEIHGHTDNIGNAKDNDALSYNRAFSVKSTLEELGIDGKRINAKGFGSIMPISTNSTEEGRAKNRRTEFLILEK